ncbi:unnamed protein product [Cercopithifilaria johnstoni]|uniref:Uncharacterized protein n=1 Tax=Cercopithifilaria johnstoni TaxID=2874296 RepID=A0A8J2MPN1_9BILA|nr:unnamed protein product [Cercopithifilaria johnstoni]
MTSNDWYNKPLNLDDIIAGGTLTLLAIIFLSIYIVVAFALYRESHSTTGFLYLLSSSINNMFLLINHAFNPGILILLKKQTPIYGRRLFQTYSDSMWFSMCYHILLLSWTRYAAISRPCQFRKQQNFTVYMLCFMCYVIALIQSIVLNLQPWYVTFYYEASVYGMVAENIELYLKGGKSQIFFIFHLLIFIATFSLYGCAFFLLFKYNHKFRKNFNNRITPNAIQPNAIRSWNVFAANNVHMCSETKLILPCICNAIIFVMGQVVITVGINGGRWTTWLTSVLFTLTDAVDSITLLTFSGLVRKSTLIILRDLFYCCNKETKVVVIKKTTKPSASSKEGI